ncbi:MAG: hypothetical protein AAF646_11905 [Pseudomonadota bacterium]
MEVRWQRERMLSLMGGSALVLGGSAIALWLPAGVSVGLALGLLLRVCWLEENIRSDLMGATHLPEAYRRTQALQTRWQQTLFGAASEPETCPRRIASGMRAQAHAHYALLSGGCAGFLASATASPTAAVVLGGAALLVAFARVDRLVDAEARLAAGGALTDEMLEDRGPISRFVLNE